MLLGFQRIEFWESNSYQRAVFFANKNKLGGGGRYLFPRIYGVKVLEEEILKNYPQLHASRSSTTNFPT
jgi:hypothetical protein